MSDVFFDVSRTPPSAAAIKLVHARARRLVILSGFLCLQVALAAVVFLFQPGPTGTFPVLGSLGLAFGALLVVAYAAGTQYAPMPAAYGSRLERMAHATPQGVTYYQAVLAQGREFVNGDLYALAHFAKIASETGDPTARRAVAFQPADSVSR